MHDWITVGIDGSDGSRAAARWAAHEADHLGLRLELMHVVDDYVPMPSASAPVYPDGLMESNHMAREILRAAVAEVEGIIPRDRIDTVALGGDRRTTLVRAAARARLMVLGDDAHPVHHRLLKGSVAASVATQASVPVVVVPAGWLPDPTRSTVVVGVKSCERSWWLVREAVRLASDHVARLVVLHASEGLDDSSGPGLGRLVDDVSVGLPAVDVETRVNHGPPARVLVEASASAGLLVIGRRPHGLPFGRLGRVGHAVLRESSCPVAVLPPEPRGQHERTSGTIAFTA